MKEAQIRLLLQNPTCKVLLMRMTPLYEGGDGQESVLALRAVEHISAAAVFFFHLTILVSVFCFWIWWQYMHPDDLQNAAVPITIVLLLVSLFWASPGVLNSQRADVDPVTPYVEFQTHFGESGSPKTEYQLRIK